MDRGASLALDRATNGSSSAACYMICTTRGGSLSLSEMTMCQFRFDKKRLTNHIFENQDKEYLLEANRTLGKKYIKLAPIVVAGEGVAVLSRL